MLCWAHYGVECVSYLFPKKKKIASFLYIILYAYVTVRGAIVAPDAVWGLADLSLGGLTLINTVILILYRKEIVRLTSRFFEKFNTPNY